jgi:hypothetical protein
MRKWMLVAAMLVASTAMAQQINLKSLEKFADKAKEKTEIDMDEAALKSGAGLLNGGKKDEAIAKKSAEGLKGVFLRAYEFDQEKMIKSEDLKPLLDQLKAPEWTSFLRNKEKNEQTEIWMHHTKGEVDGMLLIALESRELTIINVIGMKNPGDLAKLKDLGFPTLEAPAKKEED